MRPEDALKAQLDEADFFADSVDAALNGKASDFALSHPLIRQIDDIRLGSDALKAERDHWAAQFDLVSENGRHCWKQKAEQLQAEVESLKARLAASSPREGQ